MKYSVFLFWFAVILSSNFNIQAAPLSGPVIIVVGTRPEGIKMIPVYFALKAAGIPTLLCSTDQHAELLKEDVFKIFDVTPDVNFAIMKPNQDLFYITTAVLEKMKEFLLEAKPSLVLVQGDTTSALAAALAAFYLKIPVGHIEAGLRTGNKYGPFPEEINRSLIDAIATYHFAPTELSAENLIKENIPQISVFRTGHTVVDALYFIRDQIMHDLIPISSEIKNIVVRCKNNDQKIMLLTAHRRESFNGGLKKIFSAIKRALEDHPELFVIYPVHPNPAIKQTLRESGLDQMPNIFITKPVEYTDLVFLLDAVDLVATDSGGIQEEAVSLGKPTLVLRNETDRPEGITAGIAQLVGTDENRIITEIGNTLISKRTFDHNAIYGDGTASQQIVEIIKEQNLKGVL